MQSVAAKRGKQHDVALNYAQTTAAVAMRRAKGLADIRQANDNRRQACKRCLKTLRHKKRPGNTTRQTQQKTPKNTTKIQSRRNKIRRVCFAKIQHQEGDMFLKFGKFLHGEIQNRFECIGCVAKVQIFERYPTCGLVEIATVFVRQR